MRSAIATIAALVAAAAVHAAVPPPPPTPEHAARTALHGVQLRDPYRWLEDGDAPAVQHWIAAQNAYTDRVISAMPGGKAMADRVRALAITSTTRSSPILAGGTLFYLRETPPQPQPVLVAQAWPGGTSDVLVDLNKDGGGTAITGYWPSPSGRYLAYGTAAGGSELTTLHVLDVRSGEALGDTLPWAGGGTTPQGVAWDADEKGITYVRFPVPPAGHEVEQFDAELVHHRLGSPADVDRVVFGRGYSRVAEYRLLASPGARQVAMLGNVGDGGPADVYLREGQSWKKVLGHDADVRSAAWFGQKLVVVSFAGAPRGRLLEVHADGSTRELLGQRDGAIQEIAPVADGFLVVRSWGADWWAEQYDGNGRKLRRVPLPRHDISIDGIASESGQRKALIRYQGWTLPGRWAEYDADSGDLKTVFEVKAAADYDDVRISHAEGVSADGTRVPVTVLARRDIDGNGKRPTILYGYGGFDIPIRPAFIGPRLAWIERGGVFAYAHTRGGNEFGEAWHAAGQKLHKQNVYDDFHAAAMALVKDGWTDRAHLGIMGGSNGGMMMGVEVTQHPDDFRAVVSAVGIYDVIRHETDFANGAYNVSELGSVRDPAQFKATLAWSPLQNVRAGVAYPAMFMVTGANDPRVAPWQSRKFAAALQAANISAHPILLLTRMNAGHGIGAPFSQRVGNVALELTFMAHELGLPMQP